MFQTILTLIIALHPGLRLAEVGAITEDIVQAVEEGPELFPSKEDTAKLLTVFAWKESAFRMGAVGDGGRSIGLLQMNRGHLTPEEQYRVLTDRRFALQKGLAFMAEMVSRCGSLRGGLSAYATGSCRMAPKLVEHRCKQAGVRCR
jgi:hypothetical protein